MARRKSAASQEQEAAPPPQIAARDLVKTYTLGGSVIGALQGVSVEVARGEYLAVTGASGSGKSTFMNLIGALDTPTSGSLQVEGRELGRLGSDQLALYRNEKIGFVFQTFNLLARTSALDNVALPLLYSPRGHSHARDKAQGLPRQGRARPPRGAISPPSCRAGSSSGWRSPARWSTIPTSSSPTSRPARSTAAPPRRSSPCSRS